MSGFSKNPNSIHQNNLKFLADLNKLTSNRVKELKNRFPNGPNKHLSRGRYCLRSDYIPQFDEWTSFTESPPSPQPSPPPQYWTNQQSAQQLRGITQQPINHSQGFNQQPGHYQRGNSQMPSHSQRLPVNSQQKSTIQATRQQTAPNTSNTGANGQTPAPPEKKVNLSVANMLLSLGLTNSFNDKELKVLKEQGRLPKEEEQGRLSKKNGETSSVARRSQSQANQQQRRQEGKQPAIKKPVQENITLSTLTKCQNLLETYENIRKSRKRLILPKEEDIKVLHKRNKEKEVAMKRPQKRPALKGKSKEKAADLDENVEIASVKKQARPEQFIVALKHSAKRSRENDDVMASSKSMASKKRKTEHNSAVQTVSRTVQVEAETNTQEVQTDPSNVVSVAVQTDSDLPSANVSYSNSSTESTLANDEVMKMANEAHKRYEDLFTKATNLKRQGDHNENPSDYAEAACYYADAFYEQLIAASLGHNENVVNPAGFMSHVINRFDKDKKIQAAFWGLRALITRRYFIFEDKRVRPIFKDTIIRYNELIEKTGRLSEQTLAYKREHYNKALSDSHKVEDLVNEFTKYWEKTNMYKQLGFNLESDIRVAVDYIRNLLKEWRRDNDSKNKDIKKSASQPKSRSNRH
ncbi:hypothetical protein RhiirA5_355892 [Rhizophagus irregularis]|uniref:Uncharacterized protein n=3 Tax=Rhizophagus irregularis TaxID=588596 RepID=U9SPR4_RHIID|nr:hypothetical protein GLOIN_2v1542142 [Rhizophagus irregularis DAOM 181602=DAOM 197198]EXX56935.1 hypothetical protein RirG_211650 [Rhizophagus irregularis DAOM 197198w]PKC10108.1 hypothetical protein RhiirA5_355892 [Rhizophagus irregularis]PKC66265.1 hypothetical protein RhiirA1_419517 [Rhizophagus irregularis]PKY20011.1 hypothetical protein RhiirB3_407709 [Rhizophagus irregularis]POG78121.1 hypothetical protein GLOIN_2v1542142 [Rhizophagus irregularis DAOM 181602=DAOM 197198]|eukprot:XP_025184987.1 hypothetical protein GLOIN_2v1542142 [Rhizophagus irregularis DAOM 181602=DAOM 197198]